MEPAHLERLQRRVSARLGLQLRPRDRESLRRACTARARALKLLEAASYLAVLESPGPVSDREWDWLAAHLTNTESYFYRDVGQMALLRNRILPELIERNAQRRSLRLWSAGCATGEEAYSLAVLLSELLPRREGWDARVLGTDVNERALEKARRGIYTSWSFRRIPPELRARYFHPEAGGEAVNPSIRSRVTFRRQNLLMEALAGAESPIREMDLILCRNVFIYFTREAIQAVLQSLAGSLREGGYLMTGHAEVHDEYPAQLRPKIFPGSVVYERAAGTAECKPGKRTALPSGSREPGAGSLTAGVPHPPRADQIEASGATFSHGPESPAFPRARGGRGRGARAEVSGVGARGGTAPAPQPGSAQIDPTIYEEALALADLGQLEEAAERCRQAIAGDPLCAAAYRLLAWIAEEQGEGETARECLKKLIYLEPSQAAAYLDLAALYDRDGDAARARKMRAAARAVLDAAPAEEPAGATLEPDAGGWLAPPRDRSVGEN
jgi:chemotaxis protein methyltransferase CheR